MSRVWMTRATGQPRVIASGDHVARTTWTRQETAETKGELSRELRDILQGMQDLHEDGPGCGPAAEHAARHHLEPAPETIR